MSLAAKSIASRARTDATAVGSSAARTRRRGLFVAESAAARCCTCAGGNGLRHNGHVWFRPSIIHVVRHDVCAYFGSDDDDALLHVSHGSETHGCVAECGSMQIQHVISREDVSGVTCGSTGVCPSDLAWVICSKISAPTTLMPCISHRLIAVMSSGLEAANDSSCDSRSI